MALLYSLFPQCSFSYQNPFNVGARYVCYAHMLTLEIIPLYFEPYSLLKLFDMSPKGVTGSPHSPSLPNLFEQSINIPNRYYSFIIIQTNGQTCRFYILLCDKMLLSWTSYTVFRMYRYLETMIIFTFCLSDNWILRKRRVIDWTRHGIALDLSPNFKVLIHHEPDHLWNCLGFCIIKILSPW